MAGDSQKRESGQERRQGKSHHPVPVSPSFLPHTRPRPPKPNLGTQPARARACAAPTAIPFLPTLPIHFHHSLFLSLLISLPSRHSQPTHSNQHAVNHSLHGRPAVLHVKERNPPERGDPRTGNASSPFPPESLVSRSSALPVFCFLVSGPGLSFSLTLSHHTPGTVPIRTPTSSGDLPFLLSPPTCDLDVLFPSGFHTRPTSPVDQQRGPSLALRRPIPFTKDSKERAHFRQGLINVISALKPKGRLQDTKIRKWDSVNGKGLTKETRLWDLALNCPSLCSTTVYSYSPATRGSDEDLVAI